MNTHFWFFQNTYIRNIYNIYYQLIQTDQLLYEYLKTHNVYQFRTNKIPLQMRDMLCQTSEELYECVMKQMNKIAQLGYKQWEKMYIAKHFPEYIVAAKRICNTCYDILSNPYYVLGRKRILKDYEELQTHDIDTT